MFLFGGSSMQSQQDGNTHNSEISVQDAALILEAIIACRARIEKIELSYCCVWMKLQGTEKSILWRHLQSPLSKLLPYAFLRPSPMLDAEGMNAREISKIEAFVAKGILVPEIVYRTDRAVVVRDVGPSIADRLYLLREKDSVLHEALIVQSFDALGEMHAAGLCHGRPHLRDFFLKDGKIGFLDFEEEPELVMPLATAQARDLWLLLLTTSMIILEPQKTVANAYEQWRLRAPEATQVELRQMIAVLACFLPIVRLIGRVRMGSDLQRFILATEFLKTALETDAAPKGAGKAGKDDRT